MSTWLIMVGPVAVYHASSPPFFVIVRTVGDEVSARGKSCSAC